MISTIPVNTEIQQNIEAVEQRMLSLADNYNSDLQAALRVLLSSGGKRIRPRIILLLGKILNVEIDQLVTLASAIELLHTATLVHDDLIDGSLLRRGVPTLNSKWSPAATVLTGDFLFSSAAFLAAQTNSIKVMEVFSKTLMTIVNGEINQLFESRCNTSREEYFTRIYAKTASLFETCTHTTAILSNSSPALIDQLRQFGYEIGMAFQIVDDILDYTAEENQLGKPVGGDLRQGLVTLPMLYYIESNPQDEGVQELLKGKCIKEDQTIDRLIRSVAASPAIDLAEKCAEDHAERAMQFLSPLPDCAEKEELARLTHESVIRKI